MPLSKQEQIQLRNEVLEIMDKYPMIKKVVDQYGVTREQIRACMRG